MKKKLIALISMILVIQLTVGMGTFATGSVSVSASADADIIYMNDFSGYTGGTPAGMIKTHPKYHEFTNGVAGSDEQDTTYRAMTSETENDNTYMADSSVTAGNISEVVPFDKVIDNGVIHISMDYRIPADVASANKNVHLGLYTTRTSYKNAAADLYGEDVTKFASSANEGSFVPLARLNSIANGGYNAIIDDQEVWCNPNSGNYSALKAFTSNVWYKADFFVDVEDGSYKMYLDGELVGESALNANHTFTNAETTGFTGFKGFGIYKQTNISEFDVDNIYIAHYESGADKVQMILSQDVVSNSDKTLGVAFTSALKSVPTAADFTVKDESGASVTGFTVTGATKTSCTIDFSDCTLLSGELTISSATLKGINDGAMESATLTSVVPVSSTITGYTYMDEDFEGGLSADWHAKTTTAVENGNQYYTKTTVDSTDAQVVDRDSGKALNITGDGMYYFFPRGTAAEDFVMEFDVNYDLQQGDSWAFGFIRDVDFEANKANGTVMDMYNRSKVVGLTRGEEESDALGLITPSVGNRVPEETDWTVNTSAGFGELTPEAWTTVKVKFLTSDRKISVAINDGSYTDQPMTMSYRYPTGVKGVSFFTNIADANDGSVKIDNIKVYRDSAYILDQNFDTYVPSSSSVNSPYSWHPLSDMNADYGSTITKGTHYTELFPGQNFFHNINSSLSTRDTYAFSTIAGPNDTEDTDDLAVAVTGNTVKDKQNMLVHKFTKNIPFGQPFAIEMDMKYLAATSPSFNCYNTVVAISLADELDIKYRGTYTTPKDSTGLMSRAVLVKTGGNSNATGNAADGNLRAYAEGQNLYENTQILGTNSAGTRFSDIADSSGSALNMAADKWYNIKMVFNGDRSGYTLYLTDRTTNTTQTATVTLSSQLKASLNGAIAGMAISTRKINDVYADNIKVYEVDDSGDRLTAANENSVIGVEATLTDGTTVDVTDTLPANVDTLTVSFSEELNESVNSVANATPITATIGSATATLTNVYDYAEETVHFGEAGSTVDVAYTATVDGNKYIIDLTDTLDSSKTYQLSVAKNIGFASSSYASLAKPYIQAFTIGDIASDTVSVDTNELQKYAEFGYVKGSGEEKTLEACWIPVNSISDIEKYDLRYVVEGSAPSGTEVLVALASYKTENGVQMLIDVSPQTVTVGSDGTISVDEDSLLSALDLSDATCIKAFVWNKNTLVPMIELETVE